MRAQFDTAPRAALFLVLLGVVLGACALTDSVIHPRYDNIDRNTANARNESILLNIVRASKNVPLNFVAFSRVSGSTTAQGNAAMPNFLLGPVFPEVTLDAAGRVAQVVQQLGTPQRNVIFSKDTLGGSLNANTNFDISLLETKDFYAALLRPVDLINLNYFLRQGYSRELLLWLFVESFRETAMGRTVEFLNEPDQEKGCQTTRGFTRCFRDLVDIAIASGLTVETHAERGSSSNSAGKGSGATVYARLCFDPVLSQRVRRTYNSEVFQFVTITGLRAARPRCKVDPWEYQLAKQKGEHSESEETDALTFTLGSAAGGIVKYEIITRSTFGIYQFLGRIMGLGLQDEVVIRGPSDGSEDRRILAIGGASTAEGCFAGTRLDGNYYCVPKERAENTKRIFSLLTQLVALNTQIGDLGITPTVRVTQ